MLGCQVAELDRRQVSIQKSHVLESWSDDHCFPNSWTEWFLRGRFMQAKAFYAVRATVE